MSKKRDPSKTAHRINRIELESVLEELISKGHTLEWGRKKLGCTVQNIDDHLKRRGLKDKRRQAKQRLKQEKLAQKRLKKRAICRLAQVLRKRALSLEKNPSFKTALTYFEKYRQQRLPFETLYSIFSAYDLLTLLGVPYKNTEFAGFFDMYPSCMNRLLKRAGLRDLRKSAPHSTDEDKAAMMRGYFCNISRNDVAFFLKRPGYINDLAKLDARRTNKGIRINNHYIQISYRKSSQILEADEAGFNLEECAKYADSSVKVTSSVLQHKVEIGNRIIDILQVLYNNKSITKPYLSEQCVYGKDF